MPLIDTIAILLAIIFGAIVLVVIVARMMRGQG